jgi:hypothetical protein
MNQRTTESHVAWWHRGGRIIRGLGLAAVLGAGSAATAWGANRVPLCHPLPGKQPNKYETRMVDEHAVADHVRHGDIPGTCESDCVAAPSLLCDDKNLCTTDAGTWTVIHDKQGQCACTNTAVVCSASDQCHVAGICNPGTGACSNPNASNGTPCNDKNACTQKDMCTGGVCAGTAPSEACNTGKLGVCAAGTSACLNDAVVCNQTQQPSAEVCNGLDDDCDGVVDNGNPGGGLACNTGRPGVCAAGTTACTAGAVACNQTQQPSAEVCNGLDDDCDGVVDNGNPGGGLACNTGRPGVCAAGTTACTAGAVACNQTQQPSAEVCNGLDDDCDGVVDNNPGGSTPLTCNDNNCNTVNDVCIGGLCVGTDPCADVTCPGPDGTTCATAACGPGQCGFETTSYTESCTNCSCTGSTLRCDCPDGLGGVFSTSLTLPCNGSEIGNISGTLTCVGTSDPCTGVICPGCWGTTCDTAACRPNQCDLESTSGNIATSYTESCTNCSCTGSTLWCDCPDGLGGVFSTSLTLPCNGSEIGNISGTLTCQP